MTRVKKELRKRGIRLAADYECLPYEMGSYWIEDVSVNVEEATYTVYVNCAPPYTGRLSRTGEIEDVGFGGVR